MSFPLLSPLRAVLATSASDLAGRAGAVLATVILACVAGALWVAAGVVALSQAVGFPQAALIVGALFAGLALGVHLIGRAQARRRAARIAAAQARAAADLALAATLSRAARPLMPVAALVAAFLLARRS